MSGLPKIGCFQRGSPSSFALRDSIGPPIAAVGEAQRRTRRFGSEESRGLFPCFPLQNSQSREFEAADPRLWIVGRGEIRVFIPGSHASARLPALPLPPKVGALWRFWKFLGGDP